MFSLWYKDIVDSSGTDIEIEIMSGVFKEPDLDPLLNHVGPTTETLSLNTQLSGQDLFWLLLANYSAGDDFDEYNPIVDIGSNDQSVKVMVNFRDSLTQDSIVWDTFLDGVASYSKIIPITAKDSNDILSPRWDMTLVIKDHLPTFISSLKGDPVTNSNVLVTNIGDSFEIELSDINDVEDGQDYLGLYAFAGDDFAGLDNYIKILRVESSKGTDKPIINPDIQIPGFSCDITSTGVAGEGGEDYALKLTYTVTDGALVEDGTYIMRVYDLVGGYTDSDSFTISTGGNTPIATFLPTNQWITVANLNGQTQTNVYGIGTINVPENPTTFLIPLSIIFSEGVADRANYKIELVQEYGDTSHDPFDEVIFHEKLSAIGIEYSSEKQSTNKVFTGSISSPAFNIFMEATVLPDWNGVFYIKLTTFSNSGTGSSISVSPSFTITHVNSAPQLLV